MAAFGLYRIFGSSQCTPNFWRSKKPDIKVFG